jgi:hypothetical protein
MIYTEAKEGRWRDDDLAAAGGSVPVRRAGRELTEALLGALDRAEDFYGWTSRRSASRPGARRSGGGKGAAPE